METITRRMMTRTMGLAIALGLALGIAAMSPAGVDAKPVPPGGDAHQRACASLQSQAQALVNEYGRDSTTNARREAILQELRNLGRDWIDVGCKTRYGSILREAPGLSPVNAPIADTVTTSPGTQETDHSSGKGSSVDFKFPTKGSTLSTYGTSR